jgi:hypothetical protein
VDVQPYNGGPAIRAVAFMSPPERQIRDGLPPPDRQAPLGPSSSVPGLVREREGVGERRGEKKRECEEVQPYNGGP